MASIDTALRKRGIHTYAMSIAPDASLQWAHPVLVHLKDAASSDGESRGHYVVWVPPNSGETSEIWDGLAGTRSYANDELCERRSGYIILTSCDPIVDPSQAIRRAGLLKRMTVGVGTAVLCISGVLAWVMVRLFRFRFSNVRRRGLCSEELSRV